MTDDRKRAVIRGFKDLEVWQVAMRLARECYVLTRAFPDTERFGLTNQLRRASVSIPSNIAEGHGRGSPKSFLQYLWIANGSLAEVETQVLLSIDLEFIGENAALSVIDLTQQVGRMLTGLRRSIESQLP